MTIQIAHTQAHDVACDCGARSHRVVTTTLSASQGAMEALEHILNNAARGFEFARSGDMRTSAGRMYAELGFGDDPSLWPEGRPEREDGWK